MKVLFELENNDCRYMMDDTFFCAEVQREKSSYCDFHHRICFHTVVDAIRDRARPDLSAMLRKRYSSNRDILSQEIVG